MANRRLKKELGRGGGYSKDFMPLAKWPTQKNLLARYGEEEKKGNLEPQGVIADVQV